MVEAIMCVGVEDGECCGNSPPTEKSCRGTLAMHNVYEKVGVVSERGAREGRCLGSKVCSQIVLKCLYEARIGRPDILWSVNKLARSVHQVDRSL